MGFGADALRPIDFVDNIAGSHDVQTTIEETKEWYLAAPEPKEPVFFKDTAYEDLLALDRPKYQNEVVDILHKHLDENNSD